MNYTAWLIDSLIICGTPASQQCLIQVDNCLRIEYVLNKDDHNLAFEVCAEKFDYLIADGPYQPERKK
jgi:hypothetical protein